jgi:hypothetical protein
MKKQISLAHDSQVRANDVATTHSATWDVTAGGLKTRLALNGYVTESTRLLAVRSRAIDDRRAATEQRRQCRITLRSLDKTIVKVGKLVNQPELVTQTLAVAGTMGDPELQAHMQALLDRVLPFKAAFEAEGLPPDTLTNVADGIKALEAARARVAATIQDAASAEKGLLANQKLARATIQALEATAPRATQDQRDVLTKLKVARRVGPRKTQPDDATSSTSSPSTTPAPTAPASAEPASVSKAS